MKKLRSLLRLFFHLGVYVALASTIALAVVIVLGATFVPSTPSTTTPHAAAVSFRHIKLSHDTSPAAEALAELTDALSHVPDLTRVAVLAAASASPVMANCPVGPTPPTPQLSTTVSLVPSSTKKDASPSFEIFTTTQVLPPGYGAEAISVIRTHLYYCSSATLISSDATGALTLSTTVGSGNQVVQSVFRIGDVLVSVSGVGSVGVYPYQATTNLAATLNATLRQILAPSCQSFDSPISATLRNPINPNYEAPTTTEVLTPPPSAPTPDLSLLLANPTIQPPPPIGSVTSVPSPPALPTYPTSVRVQVPVADPVGPGCGWAFTKTVPPTPPSTADVQAARDAGLAKLATAWDRWPFVVSNYLSALSRYRAALASYDEWVVTQWNVDPSTTTTTTLPATTTTTTLPATTTTTTP